MPAARLSARASAPVWAVAGMESVTATVLATASGWGMAWVWPTASEPESESEWG